MRTQPIARRRGLHFDDLSQVIPEVERLKTGYERAGRWTLAQVCKHLSDSVNGAIDGFDLRRRRLERWFFAKPLLWLTYRYGIPSGYTIDPKLTPPPDVDGERAFEELRRAVERYQAYAGPLQPHPLFGRLSRAEWDRMQCFHCAHHLSFLIPTAS